MASYQVLFNGLPADDAFHTLLSKLEVEEKRRPSRCLRPHHPGRHGQR